MLNPVERRWLAGALAGALAVLAARGWWIARRRPVEAMPPAAAMDECRD